jgi:hypothetical protein
LTVTVTATPFSILEENTNAAGQPAGVCRWNGNYSQSGRLGRCVGTVICEDAVPGAYTMTDIQVTGRAFGANFTAQANCKVTGRIGGVRR